VYNTGLRAPTPGRVVDAEGKAVAGAQLDCRSASFESGANNDESVTRIANSCNWNWIRAVRTDANGEFACSWLDLPGMRYQAEFRLGDRKSDRFELQPKDGHTFKL
jgi:hypothetical protein